MTIDEAINILKGGSVSQNLDKEMQAQEMALKALVESKEWEMRLKELQSELEVYKTAIKDMEARSNQTYQEGVIYGLKYAMRCNGVCGAEVKD